MQSPATRELGHTLLQEHPAQMGQKYPEATLHLNTELSTPGAA